VTRGYDRLVRYGTVLFDLDGTLVDSGAMILASFQHATRTVLSREIPEHELLSAVGGSGLREQMEAIDPARVEELIEVYSAHNAGLHDELEPCAGILDALERLSAEGRRLAVVTAKRRTTLALAFEVLPELRRFFDVTVGAEDTTRHKPSPEPLLLALERLGANADDTVYVGDSPFDIQAAKAAEVGSVAVTWGRIHSRARLEREEPDAVVDTVEELLGAL
jgi:pyrophosphatase PpaX